MTPLRFLRGFRRRLVPVFIPLLLPTLLLPALFLSGCAKPAQNRPTVQTPLSRIIRDAYPGVENIFALGPFGGEMGTENLVEVDLPDGKTHLTGRDFIQTGTERQRLLNTLSKQPNDDPFLTSIAFPHHNPNVDPVHAEKVHEGCLEGQLPVLQLKLTENGKQQDAWLTSFSYPLTAPREQNRLIWLMSTGNGKEAQTALSGLSGKPALSHGRLPFQEDPVHQELFDHSCKP